MKRFDRLYKTIMEDVKSSKKAIIKESKYVCLNTYNNYEENELAFQNEFNKNIEVFYKIVTQVLQQSNKMDVENFLRQCGEDLSKVYWKFRRNETGLNVTSDQAQFMVEYDAFIEQALEDDMMASDWEEQDWVKDSIEEAGFGYMLEQMGV